MDAKICKRDSTGKMTKFELKQKCKEFEKYNGYTNYETWAIASWIDNTEHLQNRAFKRGQELFATAVSDENVKDKIWNECETAKFRLADELKEQFEAENPLADKPSVFSDLLDSYKLLVVCHSKYQGDYVVPKDIRKSEIPKDCHHVVDSDGNIVYYRDE